MAKNFKKCTICGEEIENATAMFNTHVKCQVEHLPGKTGMDANGDTPLEEL